MCIASINNSLRTPITPSKNKNVANATSSSSVTQNLNNAIPNHSSVSSDSALNIKAIKESNNSPVSHTVTNLFNKLSLSKSESMTNASVGIQDPTLPQNTITELGRTNNGAVIYSHNDATRGNRDVTTDYLCGHVFRTTSDLKGTGSLAYSGFIHMSEEANKNQYFDVLGNGIKGVSDNLRSKDNITIMVTGFTPFPGVKDNPTSRFLLGDGEAENTSSLGLKPPAASDLDNMMRQQYGNFVREPAPYYATVNGQQVEAGRTYTVNDPTTHEQRTITIATARLPVDVDFRDGDSTGSVLRESISATNPDAVLSFGAGTPGNSNYYVETQSYGVTGAGNRITVQGGESFSYKTDDQFITNNDFSDIYRRQLGTR